MTVRLGRGEDNYELLKARTLVEGGGLDGPGIDPNVMTRNKIYVYHASGADIELFDPDGTGLVLALAAAASGDTVWLPSVAIALTTGIAVPAGVALAGIDRNSTLNFSGFNGTGVTLGNGASIVDSTISLTSNGTTAIAIDATAVGCSIQHTAVSAAGGSASNVAIRAGNATTQTSILDCSSIGASGAGAIALYCAAHVYAGNIDPTATTDIYIDTGATLDAYSIQFTTMAGPGTLNYLAGDRSAWDAVAYAARHTNDADTATGIHHTLGTGAAQAAAGDHAHVDNTNIFNVLDYGATGDGATDDTSAIASCITAAHAASGAVYFPAGYRFVVSNINFPNGIRQVFGAGVIVDSADSGDYDAVVTLGGINCISGTGEVVEYLDYSVSIEVGESTTLRALACGALINSRIHDILISWGVTRTAECFGIDLRWITGVNVTTNVTIANNTIVAPWFSDYTGLFSAIALIGNSTAYGGYFANGDGSTSDPTLPVSRVVVANNVISGGSHGITLNGCQGCTVTGNTLYRTKQRGIVCEPVTSRCTISNNVIREYGSSAIILAYGCKYNTIGNNECYTADDTGEGAIQLYIGCQHNLVTGNNIHSSTNYGIYVAVVALYNTISNNRISGYKLAGIALENDWNSPLPGGATYSRPNFGAPPSPYTNWALAHTYGNAVLNNFIGDPRSEPDYACAIYLAQLNGYDGSTKTYCYLNEITGNVVQPYLTLAYDLFVFEEQIYQCGLNTFRNNTLYAVTASQISWTRFRSHFRICDGNEAINVPTDVPGGPGLPSIAFTDGDTSPDVSFGDSFYCANSTDTVITAFDNGYYAQEFTLQLDDHTGLTHGTYLRLQGGSSIAAGSRSTNDLLRLKYINGAWVEMWRNFNASSAPAFLFGDASDGDVTISANTTLSTIMHYANLTINAGIVLTIESRLPIYVQGTLTINGTIRSPYADADTGTNNSGSTKGNGGTGEPNGADGGNANANGGNGNAPQIDFDIVLITNPKAGANGGNSAVKSGGAGNGGSDGDIYSPRNYTAAAIGQRHINTVTVSSDLTLSNAVPGGSGGGAGGATKGGGGGGGTGYSRQGYLSVIARHIVWGGAGVIESKGGNGGHGGNSDGDGGGGGGGAGGNGGIVILCYGDEAGTRNVDVSGGAGGDGGTSVTGSAGQDGPDGYDGVVIDLPM